jgi:hypothetical protein
MSERASQLLQELLGLELTERIALADRLEASIDADLPGPTNATSDEEREAEDHRLLLDRVTEADQHPERLIDGEQAMREIEEYARSRTGSVP